MNHMQILKRAWNILWHYRALWLFGIILALTTPSAFGGGNNWVNYQLDRRNQFTITPPGEITRQLEDLNRLFNQGLPPGTWQTLIGIGIALLCMTLVLIVLFNIGRYVSQTALIQMVDSFESSGEKATWKQGFRLGWSRAAWRLFLIDLVIFVPVFLASLLLFGCAALPVLMGGFSGGGPTLVEIIATIGMTFLLIFLAVIVAVILSLILEIIRRECVLNDRGVGESIAQGWQAVRHNLKNVFLMWLILLGIRFGYAILLIPLVLLLFGVGLLVGGGIGAAAYFIAQAIASVTAGWVTAAVVGGLVFILILVIPLAFLGGLEKTYLSSAWTLAYRELNHLPILDPELPTESGSAQPA